MKPVLLPLVLITAACASEGVLSWQPETPAEREMRLRIDRLQSTVGEASLFGAAGGALIGGFTGGISGAMQGAQIGRLGGVTAGAYVRQLQAQYAAREDLLDAIVVDLRETNAELEASIAAMRVLVAERRAVLAANPSPTQQARGMRNLGEMERAIATAETQASLFGDARSVLVAEGDPGDPVLDSEIAGLRDRIAAMKDIAGTLATEL